MHQWQLVEVKRSWVPEWLFRWLCIASDCVLWWVRKPRGWMLVQPFRWMLFRKEEESSL